MQEIWKDVKDYEGKYQVSNLGRVKTIKKWAGNKHCSKYMVCNKILKPVKDNSGYYCVSLWKKSKCKTHRIHVKVAESFIPNPHNYPIVNHINGIKSDNSVDNLEWCTYKHNSREAIRLGFSNPSKYLKRWNGKYGKEHNRSKAVYQIDKNTNEVLNFFYSIREASKETGISVSSIGSCCNHRVCYKNNTNWTVRTAGGFKWRFVNH